MRVRRLSREQWAERAWSVAATYFHTPEWYEVWARWQGWTVFALEFGSDGWMPVAVRGRRAMSSPPGTYGGPVTYSTGRWERLWEAARRWARREGLTLQMLTIQRPPWPAQRWETYVAVLPPAAERIPREWRATHRNYWRRTYRGEMTVKALTVDNLDDYLALYTINYERWEEKRLRYDGAFFEMLLGLRGVNGLLAYQDGAVVAGVSRAGHANRPAGSQGRGHFLRQYRVRLHCARQGWKQLHPQGQ